MNITNNTRLVAAAIATSFICGFPFESEGMNLDDENHSAAMPAAVAGNDILSRIDVIMHDKQSQLDALQQVLQSENFSVAHYLVRHIDILHLSEEERDKYDRIFFSLYTNNEQLKKLPDAILNMQQIPGEIALPLILKKADIMDDYTAAFDRYFEMLWEHGLRCINFCAYNPLLINGHRESSIDRILSFIEEIEVPQGSNGARLKNELIQVLQLERKGGWN